MRADAEGHHLWLTLPEHWRGVVEEVSGLEAAGHLGRGEVEFRPWREGYDPADDVDRAVLATRRHVFPLWGLDPHQD